MYVCSFYQSFPPFFDEDPMQTYTKIMQGNIDYPRHFSKEAADIIRRLLNPKPTKRLGVIRGGAQTIRDHPWYKRFDWTAFQAQKTRAPYKPRIRGPEDLSNFEEYSESEDEVPAYVDDGTAWDQHF